MSPHNALGDIALDPPAGLPESSKQEEASHLSAWLLCICSVEFHLDCGQQIERVVPEGVLDPQEEGDVAFHSFPDSMSMELHSCSSVRDSLFFFRVRGKRLLYGFVFCRQRQDEKLVRGGDQRALVLVSEYPFSPILRPLVQIVGLIYFTSGPSALTEIWEESKSWPAPQPSKLIQLLFRNHTLVAQLPAFSIFPPPAPAMGSILRKNSSNSQSMQRSISSRKSLSRSSVGRGFLPGPLHLDCSEGLLSMFHEYNVYLPFQSVLPKLWALWELVITGQPLAVIAPSPTECSSAVAALISLIAPIPYAVDFRPYYTIHDATFHKLAALHDEAQRNGCTEFEIDPHLPKLVGLTNLYFLKALPGWPNTLSIGQKPSLASKHNLGSSGSKFQRYLPQNLLQGWKIREAGPQGLLSKHTEQLWMSEESIIKPNWSLCKKWSAVQGSQNSKSIGTMTGNSDMIRKHFAALTTTFLEPFQKYFVPIEHSLASGNTPLNGAEEPLLPIFNDDEFLDTLEKWKFPRRLTNQIPERGDLIYLYERFISCPNFTLWFARQQCQVYNELGYHDHDNYQHEFLFPAAKSEHIEQETLLQPRASWDCGAEVRLVEEFSRLEMSISQDQNGARENLLRELHEVVSSMPVDLKEALLSTPAREYLLEELQALDDSS